MFLKQSIIVIFCLCLTALAIAQKAKSIRFVLNESDSLSSISISRLNNLKIKDSFELFRVMNSWVDSLQGLGYLECHVQNVYETDSTVDVKLIIGRQYIYSHIDYSQIPKEIIEGSGFEWLMLKSQVLSRMECLSALKKVSAYLDRLGYPFNKVFLDSTNFQSGQIHTRLNINFGTRIYIDTMEWTTPLKVSKTLLQRLIGVKTGMYFSNQVMKDIQSRIASHKFMEMTSAPQVVLYKNKALIKLFVKDKKVSSVDALLGLLPGNAEHPGLKLNGTFNGNFINQFRQGESFGINYQSLQNNSQSLKMDLGIPYFFQLPFNPFAHFSLYKRDSLYLDVKIEAGTEWTLGKYGNFKLMIGSLSSSLLKPDLAQIKSTKKLPQALDLTHQSIGAALQFKKLNSEFNPKSGYAIQALINGSNRRIKANPSITALYNESDTSFDYSSLYKGFLEKGFALEWGVNASKYTPTGRFTTLYSSIQSGFKKASQGLQINELYRLGGHQLMRGFDEQSILAKDYIILVNEYRLITGALSYIHVHTDLGSINDYQHEEYSRSIYWSFGAGMVFNTSLGLLSISSSVGKKFPNSFDFRVTKLHVGYVSYF